MEGDREQGIRMENRLLAGWGWGKVAARRVTPVKGIPWLQCKGAWLHLASCEKKRLVPTAGSLALLSVCWSKDGRNRDTGGREAEGLGGPPCPPGPDGPCLPCTGIGVSGRQGMWTTKIHALNPQSDDSPHVQCT